MFPFRTGLLMLLFLAASVLIFTSSNHPADSPFHTGKELEQLKGSRSPIDSGEYFLGSVACRGCHGYDTLGTASVDENGNDINLYDDWQATMMALSAIDPFWRAKVSHEILVNPGHSIELQTKCTSCHAPMGHFSAMFKGAAAYTLADLLNDTLGLNGVACGGCHEIANDSLGLEFSGAIRYDTSRVEYGPFPNPLVGPMQLYVGLIPTHSTHVSRSEVCASCHTLLTRAVDLNGNYTGGYFAEQATFHEWVNSIYNSDQPCQRCHMPQIQEPVVIASNILNLPPRSPFNLHKFMGGNTTMLQMIKQNKTSLGVTASDAHFDSTITATLQLLQHSTLDMTTGVDSISRDTLYISVFLKNKAGHKFPSGYPSRRAFVQLAVTGSAGDTLFQSGMLRPDGEVDGQEAGVEPHYNIISDSSQVQIYEMVMGDVNSNITTVLERGAVELKDNRLPPEGFTTSHVVYDTVKIVGVPASDTDFNRDTAEGTGADVVHYHIPLRGRAGAVHISSAIYYQTLPPRWFTEMFAYSSDFIDSFRTMYNAADKSPVLIARDDADTTIIPSSVNALPVYNNWKVFPVPSSSGIIFIQTANGEPVTGAELWNAEGRLVNIFNRPTGYITLPAAAGVYYLKIKTAKGSGVKKVVRE